MQRRRGGLIVSDDKIIPNSYPPTVDTPTIPHPPIYMQALPQRPLSIGFTPPYSGPAACIGRVDPATAQGSRSPAASLAQPKSAMTWQDGTPPCGPIPLSLVYALAVTLSFARAASTLLCEFGPALCDGPFHSLASHHLSQWRAPCAGRAKPLRRGAAPPAAPSRAHTTPFPSTVKVWRIESAVRAMA